MRHNQPYRYLTAIVLAVASTGVLASPDHAAIIARVSEINADAVVLDIRPTPINGLNQVIADGQVIYLSDDGRYLFHGALLDMAERLNLTDQASAMIRREVLAMIPAEQRITYKPEGEVKHRVTVFTDTSCGYCRRMHQELKDYLDAGIQIDYVAYPRGHERSPAFAQMAAVWCSDDPNQAYDDLVAGRSIEPLDCAHPVSEHYQIGDRIGVQGTPAVFTDRGDQVGGYLPPAQLLERLNKARADAEAADANARRTASTAGR